MRIVNASNIVVETASQAIEQLVMANRIIANEGIVDALGHISLRNPENPNTFFIARGGLAPIEVTKDDIVEVDLEGKAITKSTQKLYGEIVIHSAILKARPDMTTVFHGHQPAIIPFTVVDIPMRPLLNTAGFIYQGVPIFDDYTPGSGFLIKTKEDGELIVKHLGERRVLLLRSHGSIIVAETIPKVVACAIFLNINATIQWQALLLGKEPKYLSPEEAKTGAEVALLKDSTMSRFWGYWTKKLKYTMPDMK
jgi:3-hydroxy-2-methylpyridine-4,5-dicarboxylate 4-decarboxylase